MEFLTKYKVKYIFLLILPILTGGVITYPSYYIIARDTNNKAWRRMGNLSVILFLITFILVTKENFIGNIAIVVNFIWAIGTVVYMIINYNRYVELVLNNKTKLEEYKCYKDKNVRYMILTILPLISFGLLTCISCYLVAQDTKEKKFNYIGHAFVILVISNFIFINSNSILSDIFTYLLVLTILLVPIIFISYKNKYKDILISIKRLEEERIRNEKEYNDGWDNSKLNVKRENGAIKEILINKIREDELILIDDLTYDIRLKVYEERELNGIYVSKEDLVKRNSFESSNELECFLEKLNYDI